MDSMVQQGKSDLNLNTVISKFLEGILGLCGCWSVLPGTIIHLLKPYTSMIEVDRSLCSISAGVTYNLNLFLR